jgi:putative redox protein
MVEASMNWAGGLKFEGISAFGKKISTDASKAGGGKEDGFKPTELVLYGLAGCAGIDVVRILEKQRQELKSLRIEMKAHHNDEYPKPFHTVEVKFIATGNNLDPKKLAKAIELSEAKYCMVSQTLQNEAKVTTSFEINEE